RGRGAHVVAARAEKAAHRDRTNHLMTDNAMNADSTWSAEPHGELIEILEEYLADLEQGRAPARDEFLAAHADLADQLAPYLDSLALVTGAAYDGRWTKRADAPSAAHGGVQQIGDFRIVREIGRGGMGI